ncbi:MAG: ATP-binding cassette domain-containing protein [Acidimicrobiia bacterium]|nr:ATP-binding cassette domain-containing protein [Acidimicrobiia bacterium]MDH4306291.1 ATP-binding cassette domain-containing protein [Acidimicrobiia bacterium]MDH5292447.1 ATP-binding cassette domain-containing protein [Acidimicrobiia bacterium]
MRTEPVIACSGVGRAYRTDSGEVWAVRGVDLEVERGSLTVLAGPSGAGKSTLLRIIAALDRPTEGSITIDAVETGGMPDRRRRRWRRRNLGYVFQDPADNLLPYLTVDEHLQMAATLRGGVENIDELARHLEIDDLSGERPKRLSSGQQQRVALAMAAVGDPAVVVADEPTAELDQESAALAIHTLLALRSAGSTVVVASHDADVIRTADSVHRVEHRRGAT